MDHKSGIEKALEKFENSPTKLAKACSGTVLRQHVEHWMKAGKVLHVPTQVLFGHDPRFFTAGSVDVKYASHAAQPAQWLKFLQEAFPRDQESIDALQQWFGCLLTQDTSQQKGLICVGPKRCGKGTHLGAGLINMGKGFVPGQNLWYTKAATDHIIFQNAQEALSPGYLANMRANATRQFKQDWWWAPGEFTPDRAPNMGNAVGK